MAVYERAIDHCRPGASLAELDRLDPRGDRPRRATPASRHTRSRTASARGRTSRRTRTRPTRAARSRRAWCSRSSPAPTGKGAAVFALEDNFLITADGAEKLSPFPDGVVR